MPQLITTYGVKYPRINDDHIFIRITKNIVWTEYQLNEMTSPKAEFEKSAMSDSMTQTSEREMEPGLFIDSPCCATDETW